jgi:hypothetical protein
VEISFARQKLDLGTLGMTLKQPDGVLPQDVFGVKLKGLGNVMYVPSTSLDWRSI